MSSTADYQNPPIKPAEKDYRVGDVRVNKNKEGTTYELCIQRKVRVGSAYYRTRSICHDFVVITSEQAKLSSGELKKLAAQYARRKKG
jgi:hypothetical protein